MGIQFFNRFPAQFTKSRHLEVAETQPRLLPLDSQKPLSVSSQTRLQYVWQASNTSWDNCCFLFVCFTLFSFWKQQTILAASLAQIQSPKSTSLMYKHCWNQINPTDGNVCVFSAIPGLLVSSKVHMSNRTTVFTVSLCDGYTSRYEETEH